MFSSETLEWVSQDLMFLFCNSFLSEHSNGTRQEPTVYINGEPVCAR